MSIRLPYIRNLKYISALSGCLSMPDATSLHHSLNNRQKQLKLRSLSGKDPAKGVFNIMHT